MADNVKISDLTELTSGSLRDVTIFPVVDGGSTQKATLSSLQSYLSDTLATDSELSTQVSNLNSTIDGLDTDDIDEGSSNLYYTNARVNTVINGITIISGAAQIEDLGFISTGTNIGALNTFTASYYEDSASFAERIEAVSASGGGATPEGTVSSSQQITDLGFIQSSTIDSLFISDRLPINILSSSEQLEQLIAINGGTGVTVTSGSGEQLSIEISSTGGGGGGGVEYDSEYEIISQSNITDESNARLEAMLLRSGDETTFGDFSSSVAAGGGGGGGSTDYISSVNNTVEAHTISFTGVGSAFSGDVNLPDGIISSSTQIEDLGFSSTAQNIRVDGLQAYTQSLKSVGLISGSGQITELGFLSESAASSVPDGTISGSQQITDLGFLSSSSDLTGITSSAGVVLADADNTGFDTSYVGENPSNLYYTDARVETHLGVIGLLTGSQGLASGSVTSSAQINYGEIRNIPKFWGDGVTISSGSSGDTANYVQITSTGGSGTLSADFYSFTASYEVEKSNFITGSSQIEALGFDPNAGEVVTLNAWTGSGGAFGIFSQSVVNQIENLETGSLTDDFNTLLEKDLFSSSLQVNYEQIPDKPNFVAGPNITINISGSSFGQTFEISGSEVSGDFTTLANVPEGLISESAQISALGYATTAYADDIESQTSQSLEGAFNQIRTDVTTNSSNITTINGNISAIEAGFADFGVNTFTGSQIVQATITADKVYVTGSLSLQPDTGEIKTEAGGPASVINMTGSFRITGSIESDEFIVGSAGTPSITSATDIDVSASADINFIAQNINITGDVLPSENETYNLGSPDFRFKDLYLSGSTIDLGGTLITRNADGNIEFLDSGSLTQKSINIAAITGSVYVSENVTVGGNLNINSGDLDVTGDANFTGEISSSNFSTNRGTFNNTIIGSEAVANAAGGASNVVVGKRAGTNLTGNASVVIGVDTLREVGGGASSLVAIGNEALRRATQAQSSVFVGSSSGGGSNATGSFLSTVAIGSSALANPVKDINNSVAIGSSALNNGGNNSVAIGSSALRNHSGDDTSKNDYSIAIGASALNNGGKDMIAIGYKAGLYNSNINGKSVLIGNQTGLNLSTGSISNVAIGHAALGGTNLPFPSTAGTGSASENTAVGYYSLRDIIDGNKNVTVGKSTGEQITNGSNNTFIGTQAGLLVSTGTDNVLVGNEAGYGGPGAGIISGSGNTLLGSHTQTQNSDDDNSIVIGSGSIGRGSNTTLIGNSEISDTYIMGNISGSANLNIEGVAKLQPQDPLPSGELGMLAVSSSIGLYFHNGTSWQEVSFV